ncbi:MAG: hypothetical protein WC782_10935 [Methylococcaceae bacterium]|jgi:hypothetical protein
MEIYANVKRVVCLGLFGVLIVSQAQVLAKTNVFDQVNAQTVNLGTVFPASNIESLTYANLFSDYGERQKDVKSRLSEWLAFSSNIVSLPVVLWLFGALLMGFLRLNRHRL